MALEKALDLVNSNPVVVFSKSDCPDGKTVKQFLTQAKATFKAIDLDLEGDGAQIQAALGQWTGREKGPVVFIGGKHIDDTVKLYSDGKLIPLLTEAGALTTEAGTQSA